MLHKSYSLFCLISIWALLIVLPAHSETIEIAAEDDWVPYAQADGTGLANEIIIAAFQSVDISIIFRVMPYARALSYIEHGKIIAAFNVPLDAQSNEKYILGEEKLFDAVSAYYYCSDKQVTIMNREQLLNHEVVGVVRGYGYGDHYLSLVKEGHILEEIANSEVDNLRNLALGRIDFTIIYDKTANILVQQLQLESKIRFGFENETTAIYLAFSRTHPQGLYYSQQFDLGMKRIRLNGVYQKIMDSY
ncbi:ABC transporter substrate-binding protein [Shewanella sp. UCD-KL12]|uniref:substrate-binding periplasmic protein n=1 Tax=Shewanella sp. UCD-KL12 TaxID=1917163 RepID=UPI000970484C|nr:transporter substrate-binding domain-containing protein [Shewanella sp. UCD-KL12]